MGAAQAIEAAFWFRLSCLRCAGTALAGLPQNSHGAQSRCWRKPALRVRPQPCFLAPKVSAAPQDPWQLANAIAHLLAHLLGRGSAWLLGLLPDLPPSLPARGPVCVRLGTGTRTEQVLHVAVE